MGTVSRTIILTDQQDNWIKDQINAGRYADESECVRDLIQGEQERSKEAGAIRAELIDGEDSGEPALFDPAEFKQRMHAPRHLR